MLKMPRWVGPEQLESRDRGAAGAVEVPRMGVWSPGFWSVAWHCLACDLEALTPPLGIFNSRAQNEEGQGWWSGLPAGSDICWIWSRVRVGMTDWFPLADGHCGRDFLIRRTLSHTHPEVLGTLLS